MTFPYSGRTVSGCLHSATPSAADANCSAFFKATRVHFGDDVDEFAIVDANDGGKYSLVATCYRQQPLRSVSSNDRATLISSLDARSSIKITVSHCQMPLF